MFFLFLIQLKLCKKTLLNTKKIVIINKDLKSQVGGVAANGVNEFFETLITLAAYDGAREIIKKTTQKMDDGILKEAIENSLNVVAFGLVSVMLQAHQNFLISVFYKYTGIIAFLVGLKTKVANSIKSKLAAKAKNVKGAKALFFLKMFDGIFNRNVETAKVVAQVAETHFNVYNASAQHSYFGDFQVKNQALALEKEKHSAALAHYMQSALHDANILKLLTGKFTAKDKNLIKKLTGFDNIENKDIEALNHVKDFMFSFDADGNPIALTEAFVSLINTVGYYNKKSTKNP